MSPTYQSHKRFTNIEWCDWTYNPWRGCSKVSAGCKNCYIVTTPPFRITGLKHGDPRVKGSDKVINGPLVWDRKPWICDVCGRSFPFQSDKCPNHPELETHRGRVFLGSLMDIFDLETPVDFFGDAITMVQECEDLDFLMVTKRPENFRPMLERTIAHYGQAPSVNGAFCSWLEQWLEGEAPKNVWMITSTENQEMLEKRLPLLLAVPAPIHGLSCEPLLEPLRFTARTPFSIFGHKGKPCCTVKEGFHPYGYTGDKTGGIDWVIAGGESGREARPCHVEWLMDIQEQCLAAGAAYFCKQLGANVWSHPDGRNEAMKLPLHHRKGGNPTEWHPAMRVREFPKTARRD